MGSGSGRPTGWPLPASVPPSDKWGEHQVHGKLVPGTQSSDGQRGLGWTLESKPQTEANSPSKQPYTALGTMGSGRGHRNVEGHQEGP